MSPAAADVKGRLHQRNVKESINLHSCLSIGIRI